MAKKEVKWNLKAIHDKIDILDYWIERNKSKTYGIIIDKLFDKSTCGFSRTRQKIRLKKYPNKNCSTLPYFLPDKRRLSRNS